MPLSPVGWTTAKIKNVDSSMCSILVQSCSKFAINSVAERMIHRSHALTYAHRFAIYFNSSYAKFPCNDVNHEYTIAMMAIIKDSQKNIKFNLRKSLDKFDILFPL